MGYSSDPSMVRVDFFKPSGKWYVAEVIRWTGPYDEGMMEDAFIISLRNHLYKDGKLRLSGMLAVCLRPYHKLEYPVMINVDECLK